VVFRNQTKRNNCPAYLGLQGYKGVRLMNTVYSMSKEASPLSPSGLAGLGGGKIAYVKPMLSDDIRRLFPEAPELESGLQLFALLGADGFPIVLTDTMEGALANAWEKQLVPMSVH
jgi:hypothetical protein